MEAKGKEVLGDKHNFPNCLKEYIKNNFGDHWLLFSYGNFEPSQAYNECLNIKNLCVLP